MGCCGVCGGLARPTADNRGCLSPEEAADRFLVSYRGCHNVISVRLADQDSFRSRTAQGTGFLVYSLRTHEVVKRLSLIGFTSFAASSQFIIVVRTALAASYLPLILTHLTVYIKPNKSSHYFKLYTCVLVHYTFSIACSVHIPPSTNPIITNEASSQ